MIGIAENKHEGRFIIATMDISAGAAVLQCLPYSSVVCDEFTREVCAYCFKYENGKRMKIICDCKCTRYCSTECQQLDTQMHTRECGKLQELQKLFKSKTDFIPNRTERELLRLFVISVCRRSTLINNNNYDDERDFNPASRIHSTNLPEWDDVMMMQNNQHLYSHNDETVRYSQMFTYIEQSQIISADLFNEFMYREMANSFGIWDTPMTVDECSDLLGYAVYPLGSYFNHSCAPNILKERDGRLMIFKTSVDVKKGDKLCISYGSIEQPLEIRRNRLKQNYFFDCNCDRCVSELLSSK